MRFPSSIVARLVVAGFSSVLVTAQSSSAVPDAAAKVSVSGSTISLRATSTMNIPSEMGGAFMSPTKCDADGNLYIRKYASDRPMLSPVVKIDPDGKRVAFFDPAAFSKLALDRADAFSPGSDGGMYQIAQRGVVKPQIYVLHFSSDGSPSTPTLVNADLEVYTFAAFAGGNFLVSGVRRDVENKDDRGRNFSAVFSADGRELAQLSFAGGDEMKALKTDRLQGISKDSEISPPAFDLAEAEAGVDGNLYVMRESSPALVYVIAPSGRIMKTLKITGPRPGSAPSGFHVSGNRMALSYWNEARGGQTVVVADAQTGRTIASYADATGLGPSFACYSANDNVYTFLKLGEGNELGVIRAEPQ